MKSRSVTYLLILSSRCSKKGTRDSVLQCNFFVWEHIYEHTLSIPSLDFNVYSEKARINLRSFTVPNYQQEQNFVLVFSPSWPFQINFSCKNRSFLAEWGAGNFKRISYKTLRLKFSLEIVFLSFFPLCFAAIIILCSQKPTLVLHHSLWLVIIHHRSAQVVVYKTTI